MAPESAIDELELTEGGVLPTSSGFVSTVVLRMMHSLGDVQYASRARRSCGSRLRSPPLERLNITSNFQLFATLRPWFVAYHLR
jgi:hypothetical protein